VPIVTVKRGADAQSTVIGVVTRHTNLGEVRTPSRQQISSTSARTICSA